MVFGSLEKYVSRIVFLLLPDYDIHEKPVVIRRSKWNNWQELSWMLLTGLRRYLSAWGMEKATSRLKIRKFSGVAYRR